MMVRKQRGLFYNWLDVLRALGACSEGVDAFREIVSPGTDREFLDYPIRLRDAYARADDSQFEFVLAAAGLYPTHPVASGKGCPGCEFDEMAIEKKKEKFPYEVVRDALIKEYVRRAREHAAEAFYE